jgi:hypothetical protein
VPGGNQNYFGKSQQIKLVKTKRDSAEVHAECRVCVFVIDGKDHDQQHNDDRMGISEAKFHFGYQKERLHFGVPDTGCWRSQESRLFITGVPKCRNAKRRKSRNRHINRSWRIQESRIFMIGVLKCRNVKHRKS